MILVKLTKSQQEVVDLMQSGWQLASSSTSSGSAWIQQGGAGRGGKSRTVNVNTLHALFRRGVITTDTRGYPTTTWRLVK